MLIPPPKLRPGQLLLLVGRQVRLVAQLDRLGCRVSQARALLGRLDRLVQQDALVRLVRLPQVSRDQPAGLVPVGCREPLDQQDDQVRDQQDRVEHQE